MRRSSRCGRPRKRARDRSVSARQGAASAARSRQRPRAAAEPAHSRRADDGARLSRAAQDDDAGERAEFGGRRDRDDHPYAMAGRRICAPRDPDARGPQALRWSGARIFPSRRAAPVVVIQAARGHDAESPLRHARAKRRRILAMAPGARAMKTSLYIDRGSIVHRLHPTLKIFALFAAFWSIYWIDNPLVLLPFMAAEVAVALAIGAGENLYRFRWFFLLIVLPTMITWMISFRRGTPLVNLWIIHPSAQSILFGLGKGMKVAALVLASVLFLSSTKVEELSVGLSRLGFPYRFGFTITLAFRLVPLFIDSALTVVDAQRLRGYDFDAGGPFERVRRYVPVIIPVFMGALRKANNMAMALEARGFGRRNEPTSFIEYRMHTRDAEAFVLLLAVGTLAFMLYWTGYGSITGASIHS